ncbi:MAG TPA: hypothetical protein GX709_04705 [Clostridiales bacterium]|nr:hypothetical protein [Clostridiales bacterium]
MAVVRKTKISKICIVAIFVALFLAIIFLPFLNSNQIAYADEQGQGDQNLAFTVDAGDFVPGTYLQKDVDALPVFELAFSRLGASEITSLYGLELFLEYVELENVVNDIGAVASSLNWTDLKIDGAQGRANFDSVSNKGYLSAEYLIDRFLENPANQGAQKYRRMIYFRAKRENVDNPGTFSYYYYTFPVWDVYVNLVPPEMESKYEMEITPFGFMPSVMTYKTQLPEEGMGFSVRFLSESTQNNMSSMILYFAIVSEDITDSGQISDNAWSQFPNMNDPRITLAKKDVDLNTSYFPDQQGVNRRHIYFKVQDNSAGEVTFLSPSWFKIILDPISEPSDLQILNIEATYDGNRTYPIHISDQSDLPKVWSKEGIRLEVNVNLQESTEVSAHFVRGILANQQIQFDYNSETARYKANILVEDIDVGHESIGMYSGELKIVASAGNFVIEQSIYVYIDKTTPNIACDAITENGDSYNYGDPSAWAYQNIVFEVLDIERTRPISGVKYEYLSENGWQLLTPAGDKKKVTISRTQDVYIRATTGAGKINMLATKARIDKKTPKLKIVAKDGKNADGKEILSADYNLDGESLGNRRIGYAQDKITFELSNLTTQDQTANTIKYYWKKSTDPDASYEQIQVGASNKYIFVLENKNLDTYMPMVNIKINIKIVAMTGLGETKDFIVTILPSGFSVRMDLDLESIPKVPSKIGEKVNDEIIMWYAEALPVTFIAGNNITSLGASQYKAFSFIKGREEDTTKELPLEIDSNQHGVPAGNIRMKGYIDRSLKNESLGFYLVDKAENKVNLNASTTPMEPMFTPNLYLDTQVPEAYYERFIVGGSGDPKRLNDGDWAKGVVQVVINIDKTKLPYSGVALFEVYENGGEASTEVSGKQDTATKIIYSIRKEVKGVYRYMLRSGSGIGYEIVVEVNIDNTDIVLREIKAKTIDNTGQTIKDNLAIDGTEKVSSTIRINFDTNHQDHFSFEYIDFSNSGTPDSPDAGPTLISDRDYFDISMPLVGGEGLKQFGFRLYSKAKDQNEEVSTTGPGYVFVKFAYDTRTYYITSSPSSSGQNWQTSATRVDLKLADTTANIKIIKYQVRIDLASAPTDTYGGWIDIDAIPNSAEGEYSLSYLFPGLKWYFNDEERLKDIGVTNIGTLYADLTQDQRQYASYNGNLYFRAISESGMPSNEAVVKIKQDTSAVNPIYGLYQESGEIDFAAGSYLAYSKQDFKYWAPEKNYPSKALIIANKAEVKYYYYAPEATDNEVPDVNSTNWKEVNMLTSAYILDSRQAFYWLKGTRADTSEIVKLIINKQAEDKPLTISFVDAENGNLGNQDNLYLFEWVQRAGITVKVKSLSKVYYWYKIGEEDWMPYFDTAMEPGIEYTDFSRTLIFVGDASYATDDEQSHAKVVNIKNTVKIKVTNQAGDEAILATNFYIKIDVNYPKLDEENIVIKNISGEIINIDNIENLNTVWYPEDLVIEILRNHENSSGVEYSYRLEGQSEYVPIGNNRLNTNNIIGFPAKGGIATIVLRAEQKSHSYSKEFTLSFKIDKVTPDFLLEGIAYKNINETLTQIGGKLASGTWINADEVKLSIRPREDSIAISPSRYFRYAMDENAWVEINIEEPYKIRSLETVQIKCVTEAGREITKVFQANIDNVAPTINAGKFQNPTSPENPTDPLVYNEYYIDQQITYIEDNLKFAEYNGYPLSYGHIIATNTIDNTVEYVHIVIEDLAGNRSELKFKMRPFPLTAMGEESAITLSEEHLNMLIEYENQYLEAKETGSLSSSRDEYFAAQIARLKDRVATMEKQIADFQAFLRDFDPRATFELHLDFEKMKSYWDKFYSGDPLIEYPQWQQEQIVDGYENKFENFKAEYNKLLRKMVAVVRVQKSIAALPATNVVVASDYQNVMAVYAKYIELESDQKAVFNSNLKNKIIELKRICEVYLLQDEVTGVEIYGETLVAENPGKQLIVQNIDKNSEVFVSIQDYLMQTQTSEQARSVVSINSLSLSGTGSSYDLGTFNITLTIPEEYRQYKLFAVYRRAQDRTLHLVDNVQRTADGKQVFFPSTELGTYVLAASSNIQPRSDSGEIYGTIAGIDINAEILTYITFTVIGIFIVFLVVIIIVSVKRKRFLAKYNKAHKGALVKRGIDNIPKGNPAPASNPARPEERIPTEKVVRYKTRKSKKKLK